MQSKIQTAKKYARRGALAYAAFETHKKAANELVDRWAHTWTVREDYSTNLREAAAELVERSRRGVPLVQRNHTVTMHNKDSFTAPPVSASMGRLGAQTWDLLRVPGLRTPFQVRGGGRDQESDVVFRALRKVDLEKLKIRVKEIQAEIDADIVPEVDYDPFDMGAPTINILGWSAKDGQWETRKSRVARTFSSVVLPSELEAEIIADLKTFTDSHARMQRLEMPWRRGYLLEGPPGTGKTSTALAIAAQLRFNLASLSLTGIESDDMLKQAVSQLRSRTVLALEDIDAYSISHEREHNNVKDGALSLSGLLNALDGFETPDGLVVIGTTNHVDRLDEALIRNGRFDRTFHLGYIQAEALERLFQWFYEEEPIEPAPSTTALAKLSPSTVAETFKQHLDTPVEGWAAINALIHERQPERILHAVA